VGSLLYCSPRGHEVLQFCKQETHRINRKVGRDSSVGIVTRYGLDGPGIAYRCGRDILLPSRPTLGLTQPSIQWVPGLSSA